MRLRLAVVLIFVVGVSGFAQESEDWYQGKPIRNIVFEGLRNVNSSELNGITEPYLGSPFSDDVYWEILGRLYALEYFDSITPTAVRTDALGSEVIIRFAVVERPIISRINFTGNSGVRRSELLDTVTMKVNDVATQVKLRVDEIAITNKYLEKGFPDIKVRSEMVPDSNGSSMVINFYIEEGEKVTIDEFRFEGNQVFSSRTLQRQLSLKTKGIINDGAFQESKLIADRETLVQYYHDRGYIDAGIIDVSREITKDEKGNNSMIITFRIYEGRIYNFGGVTFEGNKIFSTEQLDALVYSKPGEIASDRRVQADLMRVADLYYENGYIFNLIDPFPVKDTENGTIGYNIVIVERGRAHIENIIIRGNKKTRDAVILREIPLEAGDVFSKTKVMEGLRNLYNLQFFSQIIPDTPVGSTDSLMDLVINVEEQPSMDIQFGLTFSGTSDPDAFPVSGMVQWNDRNFRGTGNQMGVQLNASPDTQNLSLNYTQSWIFGLPLSGGFDLTAQRTARSAAMDNMAPFFYNDDRDSSYAYPDGFGSYEDYINGGRVPSDEYLMPYDQWNISLGLSTGYRWGTFLGNLAVSGGARVGMMHNVFDTSLYRPFDPVLREQHNSWTPATSLWSSVSLDQRDIYYDPSKGYYAIQRFGYYGLLGIEAEHYFRTDTDAEWFHTLFNLPVSDNWSFKAVFGIHSGLSFVFPQPFYKIGIESANKLAVDGMFVGRGWSGDYNNKGLALWENWAEVRIPLAPGILAWDFFFDAAGVKPSPNDFFNNFGVDDGTERGHDTFFMRFSMGGGFRFTIPQFPLKFSMAKRFKIVDGDVRWETGPLGGMDFVISFALSTY